MDKNIKIWENRLEITKESAGYLINSVGTDLFIHADELKFKSYNTTVKGRWLRFYCKNAYIGSIWISTDTDTETIKKFLEETK